MEQKKHYFTIGHIIGEAVNFYTSNLLLFWMPFLIISAPLTLLFEFVGRRYLTGSVDSTVFTLINSVISSAIGLYITVTALNKYRNKSVLLGECIERTMSLLFRYILLQILIVLGIVGGTFLLVIPGIIFSLRWTVSSAAFVEEGLGIRKSMKRSKALTSGFKGEIFVIYLLMSLLGLVVFFGFSLIANFLSDSIGSFMETLTVISSNPFNVTSILYTAATTLLSPLYPLLTVIIFFNLKKEKEGYDIEELAGSFLDDKPKNGFLE